MDPVPSCPAPRPQRQPRLRWRKLPDYPSNKPKGGTSMARFDGKVILISGGARGQGAAESRLLVAQGGKVVIGDVLEKEGSDLANHPPTPPSFLPHHVTPQPAAARPL